MFLTANFNNYVIYESVTNGSVFSWLLIKYLYFFILNFLLYSRLNIIFLYCYDFFPESKNPPLSGS